MPSKDHWETVYTSKASEEVGWYEVNPTISLDLIQQVSPAPRSVIDVGGGQSFLVDHLVDTNIEKLAVLDISSVALEHPKQRLGDRANKVEWIEADVTTISDVGTFDLWHDRAVLHFLIEPQDRAAYVELATKTIPVGGHLVIGTFALDGPETCSGLPVCRYDADMMAKTIGARFDLIQQQSHAHITPSGKAQSYFFGVFRRV
jgi:SAM-dependent methyltransferase